MYLCRAETSMRTLKAFGEDWFFLAALGIIMALLSVLIDKSIEHMRECTSAHTVCHIARACTVRLHAYHMVDAHSSFFLWSYLTWVGLTVGVTMFTVGFVNWLAPQACGSGIPEMKTILKGVVLKEYLTFKTFVAKIIGVILALSSGVPVGKEVRFIERKFHADNCRVHSCIWAVSWLPCYHKWSLRSRYICTVDVPCMLVFRAFTRTNHATVKCWQPDAP
jgi:chloride channel 2